MADLARQIGSASDSSLFIPMALMITGLGIEAAIFPLNAWLPDAHSSAPSSVSAILSGIAIEVGLYAVIRVLFTIFAVSNFFMFFMVLGVLTILIGEMSAFAQNNIKRMLAYSSIGQIGLILFAFSISTQFGIAGGFFQMVSHTLAKALLFLTVGFMIYRSGSMKIASLAGIGQAMPLTALCFTIGSLSIIGLPPFIGFSSKFLIIKAALIGGNLLYTILIGIVLLGTVIEGTYFFRVIQTINFKKTERAAENHDSPVAGLIPMVILAALIVILGVCPNIVARIIDPAASEFLNRIEYIRSVLG